MRLLLFPTCVLLAVVLPACETLSEKPSSMPQFVQLPTPVVDMPPPPSEILQELKLMQKRWDSERQERLRLLTPSEVPTQR